MSRVGLTESREKLANAGLYVEGDVTALPFQDGTFDAFICAYALFHVPADEQERVVRELYRTLGKDGIGVVLYVRPDSPMTKAARRFAHYRTRLARKSRVALPVSSTDEDPADVSPRDLYWHAHEYTWWERFRPEWDIEIRSLAAVDQEFTTSMIPDNRLGVAMLHLISFLEERAPRTMIKLGRYPIIVIRKK